MFKNKTKFTGYQMLKDILNEEKALNIYQGRAAIVVKHEKYIEPELDLDTDDSDEVPF